MMIVSNDDSRNNNMRIRRDRHHVDLDTRTHLGYLNFQRTFVQAKIGNGSGTGCLHMRTRRDRCRVCAVYVGCCDAWFDDA